MSDPNETRFGTIETPCPKCGELIFVTRFAGARFYECEKCGFEHTEDSE
jgi:predicted RNA-binding Zn-ribbon protein involved in translation (DUF1610 family)